MGKKLSIKNMSVKAKIISFSVMMLLCMIVIATVGLLSAKRVNEERTELYDDYAMEQYNLIVSSASLCEIKSITRELLVSYYVPGVSINSSEKIAQIEGYEKAIALYTTQFEEKLDLYDNDELTQSYKTTNEKAQQLVALMRNAIELINTGEKENVDKAAVSVLGEGLKLAEDVDANISNLLKLVTNISEDKDDEVNKDLNAMTAVIIAAAVIAIIIAIIYALLLIKYITLPVIKLEAAAKKLAVGDVDVDCEKESDDDLGNLMDNFKIMVDAIKEQASIAQCLAAGDMTVSITPRSEKDLLGKAMKKLADDQNATLGNVKESTVQVTAGSEQVAMASQSLAQGATEQASALEQVTVSIDDIAERTKLNAAEANRANELVHNVKQKAVTGNEQMKAMKGAMDDINETSESISKIIKVINDIAFQTNILALNAAVEAARAGVHGKGFSVVAEEVRNLAGKCGSAAEETEEMIDNSIRTVQHGSKLAAETEKSLNEIVDQIDQIVDIIVSIAAASNDQATAVSQVDQAINQVSQVVQTNSATSEQCAAASEELSNQAANLRNLMANFKLVAGRGGSMGSTDFGFTAGSNYNESVISLDGEFGKY